MSRTCRIGVHGRNNVNFEEADYQVIRESRIEAVKMMSQTRPQVLERIKRENSDVEIITRLYDDRVGSGHHPSPAEFAERMFPILEAYKPYCKKFHLLNEPNHVHRYEGWGATDEDARNFNMWFLEAYDRLKQKHPWALLGFPGLALPDAGHRDRAWLNICRPAIEKADWLGCHCYWQTPPGQSTVLFHENFGLNFKHYHQLYPNKTIEILECGNSNIQNNYPISDEDVAREFTDWLKEIFNYSYINSAAYFILSSQDTGNWEFFAWRKEDGHVKPIAGEVARLARPPRVPVQLTQSAPATPDFTPTPEPAADTEPATSTSITNQNMVDAFFSVGKALGVEPAPWGLLSKSGLTLGDLIGNREAVYSGPSLAQLSLSPDERRLMREKLAEIAPNTETLEADFTNQNVIDAFYQAGRKLGLGDWDLLGKAGLSLGELANDRNSKYKGERISQKSGLSEAEKSAVKAELKSILGLGVEEELPSFSVGSGKDSYLKDEPTLIGSPAAMPKKEQLKVSTAQNNLEERVCQVYNRYGWVLNNIADILRLDLALVVAIVASETSTRGLDAEGKLIFRFEAHIFQQKLGQDERFNLHFRYDPQAPWQKQQWRATSEAAWQDIHASQAQERAAFELACSLNKTAAQQAIRFGLAPMLGCHYALAGYNSVQEMYNALAASERSQLVAWFDMIAGPNYASREVEALRANDIDGFALLYKQDTAKYGALLRQAVTAFARLRAA